MIEEPQGPRYLPNNPAKHEPVIDKNTNNKYIRKGGIRTHDTRHSCIKI